MRRLWFLPIAVIAALALAGLMIQPGSTGGDAALPRTVSDQAAWLGDYWAASVLECQEGSAVTQAALVSRDDLAAALRAELRAPLTGRQLLDIQVLLAAGAEWPVDSAAPEADLRNRVARVLEFTSDYLAAEPLTRAERRAIGRQLAGLIDYFHRLLAQELTPAPADAEGSARLIAGDVYVLLTERVAQGSALAASPWYKRPLTEAEMAHMEERARYWAAAAGSEWRDFAETLLRVKEPGYVLQPADMLGATGNAACFLADLQNCYVREEAAP